MVLFLKLRLRKVLPWAVSGVLEYGLAQQLLDFSQLRCW
jgi:hypothetical protein